MAVAQLIRTGWSHWRITLFIDFAAVCRGGVIINPAVKYREVLDLVRLHNDRDEDWCT